MTRWASDPVESASEASCTKKFDVEYLIVGGDSAAFVAAKEIVKNDDNARVLIVSGENHPPYKCTLLSSQYLAQNVQFEGKNLNFSTRSKEEDAQTPPKR